jgi:cysteine synthase B
MDILALVGHTPLIELTNCSPRPGVRLFAKLEGQNPTGSIKDRVVSYLIRQAATRGVLHPGQPIVEATTGNTGIALAMVGQRLGHPVRVVVPDTVFPGVARVLTAYGATIEWVPGDLGIIRALEVAWQIVDREGAFFLNQFGSPDNPRCHYETTGVEILAACPDVDVFVCGLGTGGTIMGVGQRLREQNPAVRLIAAEPHSGEQLQGLRSMSEGFVPPILDLSILDTRILVHGARAFRAVHELLAREGVLVGPSSGAVLHAALRWAQHMERVNIVVLFADAGWKYLSAPAYPATEPLEDEEELDDILWW